MKKVCKDFSEFKNELQLWLNLNPNMKFLDGSKSGKPPGIPFSAFWIKTGDWKAKISFHSDIETSVLLKILNCELKDFIILPPSKNFKHWRFDFLNTFSFEDYENRHGLYAYLKNEPKDPIIFSI